MSLSLLAEVEHLEPSRPLQAPVARTAEGPNALRPSEENLQGRDLVELPGETQPCRLQMTSLRPKLTCQR